MTFSTRGITAKAYQTITQPLKPIKCRYLGHLLKTSPHIGPAGRFDLAAEIARTSPLFLGRHIEQLNIPGEENRSALAEMVGKIDPWVLQETLPNFKLAQGSPVVYQFVKTSFEKEPSLSYIPFRELLSEEQRITFVEQMMGKNPFLTLSEMETLVYGPENNRSEEPNHYRMQQLEDKAEKLRFEKAKEDIALLKDLKAFKIEKYRLHQNSLFEIAKLVLPKMDSESHFSGDRSPLKEKDYFEIAHLILKLNEEQRIDLVSKIIEINPFLTVFQIKTLCFGSEEVFSKQKANTQQLSTEEGSALHPQVQKLENKAEQLRFLKAKQDIKQLANIETFEIEKYRLNPESTLVIAKLILSKMDNGNNFPIHRYNLDEKSHFEIAKMALQKTKDVSLFPMDKYFLSQNDRYELTKIIVTKDPFISDEQIKKFAPRETFSHFSLKALSESLMKLAEDLRFEKAKKDISKNKNVIPNFSLPSYRIENKEYRKELAFLAVRTNVSYIQYIDSFELEEQDRVEIAILAAQKDGKILSENIDKFQISDEEKLFAIAISAILQNKEATTRNLHKFRFTNEKYLKLFYEMFETKKSTGEKKASSESSDEFSKLSKEELFKKKKQYESLLSKIQGLGKDKGAFGGEKQRASDQYAEVERKLRAVEEELKRRK